MDPAAFATGYLLWGKPPTQDINVALNTQYDKSSFPKGQVFPYNTLFGAAKALKNPNPNNGITWDDIKATPAKWDSFNVLERRNNRMRHIRREVVFICCCFGLGTKMFAWLYTTMFISGSVMIGQMWMIFLQQHARALFNNAAVEFANAWDDFAFNLTVTLTVAFIAATVESLKALYYYRRHQLNRVNRRAFELAMERIQYVDPHFQILPHRYDSEVEPEAFIKLEYQKHVFKNTESAKVRHQLYHGIEDLIQAEKNNIEIELVSSVVNANKEKWQELRTWITQETSRRTKVTRAEEMKLSGKPLTQDQQTAVDIKPIETTPEINKQLEAVEQLLPPFIPQHRKTSSTIKSELPGRVGGYVALWSKND